MKDGRQGAGRHATIFDVAREAQVSKSTVSNVIRGASGVAPATRTRVMEAVAQLDYRPNILARHLVLQQTTTVGVVVGDLGNPFNAEMAKHIAKEAALRGYRAMFCNTQGDVGTRARRPREPARIPSRRDHLSVTARGPRASAQNR